MMKSLLVFCMLGMVPLAVLAQPDIARDGDWAKNVVTLKNTPEADYMIRVGDVDNLNFGWPDDFDPFCGRVRESHGWPWEVEPDDIKGMDDILLSSKYVSDASDVGCGRDGYADFYDPARSKPAAWTIPLDVLKDAIVSNAFLQLFVDDFQSPTICSKFQLTINGTRFVEGEKYLNSLDQSGPMGKLITIPLPEEFFAMLQGTSLSIKIDESVGAADGWAVDFIKLIVNRKSESICKGDVHGFVVDKETGEPIPGAKVFRSDNSSTVANESGEFFFKGVPTGLEMLRGVASGYQEGSKAADVAKEDNQDVIIQLERGSSATFDGKEISAGESLVMNKILFDQGKADLRPESKTELDKIAAFLKVNPTAEIELSGHTSSEGEAAMNRSLSYRRVKACKDYITAKGLDTGRITAVGFGPDRPVADNGNEAGRAQNRRVEMRVVKL